MKDPFDSRPDAYALLNCSESCTRADAQRNYTSQLVRRTAPQRDLQAARELLVRADQRLIYDAYRYNISENLAGTEAFRVPELDLNIMLPLPPRAFDPEWLILDAIAPDLESKWSAPDPPDIEPLLESMFPDATELPIEFDS